VQNTNQILTELLEGVDKWAELKPKLSDYNTTKTNKTAKKTIAGKIFEYFSKYYFETDPEKIDLYDKVWLYEEIPLEIREKLSLPSIDHGIDILLKTFEGEFHAVQCKFKNDESKTLSWSGDKIANVFALGTKCDKVIVFSNTSSVTNTAKGFEELYEEILNDKLLEITSEDFIRILDKSKGNRPKSLVKFKPLDHQVIAIEKVVSHLKENERAQLILPCGAGKTLTSLWIKEELKSQNTLVMVPSLALLKQIKNDWARHKNDFYKPLYVCSEKDIDKGNSDETVTHGYEIGGPVSTNPKNVTSFLLKSGSKTVFSTYQSIAVVEAACSQLPNFKFDCIICDEAHRTAGSSKSNTFTIIHDNNRIPSHKRLYMTATPKVVSTSQKAKLGDDYDLLCDMSNPEKFGEEAHRMSFGEAIDLGILVDYKIVGIGVTDEQVQKYIIDREYIDKVTVEELAHNFALEMILQKTLLAVTRLFSKVFIRIV
jgi:predicted helicase